MSEIDIPVITVDGPGGSGKGTISVRLAKALGWHFLDSGALYRVLALCILNRKIAIEDESAILKAALELDVCFNADIVLEGKGVTELIRSELCGSVASKIAVLEPVREALLARQRDFRKLPGLVADGRDMGTVVFPHAKIKLYLDATPEERAKRRYWQLKNSVPHVNLTSLLQELEERDARDKQRAIAPLKPAEDAVVIDTTGMAIDVVFDSAMGIIKQRLG
jgi:cytidylate kinase